MKTKYSIFGHYNDYEQKISFRYILTPRGLYYLAEELYIHFDNTFEVTPVCKEVVENGKWSGCVDVHTVISLLSISYEKNNAYEKLYNKHMSNQLNRIFGFMLLHSLEGIKQALLDNGYKEIKSI